MADRAREDVTALLRDEGLSPQRRTEMLLPLLYEHLRAAARRQLGNERSDHTLQATALVHEAYVRLAGGGRMAWKSRAHFFAAAAEAMRRILIDHARGRGRAKRGGGARRLPLDMLELATSADHDEILSLDEAITRLEKQDEALGRLVRLRFYAGLSIEETARAMELSPATVKRRWEFARAWLYRELSDE